MKSINLNSEITIKLSDLGKQLYYLYIYDNREKEAELLYNLDLEKNLKIPLKKIFEIFGDGKASLEEVFTSGILIDDVQKEFALDNIVGIKLSEQGKNAYYLYVSCNMANIFDSEEEKTYRTIMENRLVKDGLLMISLKELIMIFGGEDVSKIFAEESFMIDERDLKEPGVLEETTSKNRA